MSSLPEHQRTSAPAVSAIVLAYGPEPFLEQCVQALLASTPRPEIVVVDNEADPTAMSSIRVPGVRVVTAGRNLGFSGGANFGAGQATGDVLVFVNSDAVVAPGAIAALAGAVASPSVGLASGSIRLAAEPELLNSAGNPVQYLMFSWAGGYRLPATPGPVSRVASISGSAFAVRREVWQRLGGFDAEYFAYCEDVDLSWRAWQAGYEVLYVPDAVVSHHYEFSRNAGKSYLLERNRLINLLTLPQRRTRWLVAPMAVPVELGVLLAARRDGWAAEKTAGWRWLWENRGYLADRRVRVAGARERSDRELSGLLRGPLDPPPGLGPAVPRFVNAVLSGYWRVVQHLI
ncbi:MAG: glycosyltransferase family 2 protein [Candidatus Nanopelagicales bacterium]